MERVLLVADVEFLDEIYYGNAVRDYAIAAGVAAGLLLGSLLFQLYLLRRLRKLAEQTETKLDDGLVHIAERTRRWTVLLVAWLIELATRRRQSS